MVGDGPGGWGDRTRSGIAWSGAALVSGRLLTFTATLVLARLLTPAEFGVVAAVLVFLSLLELVSDLGMKATVIYEQEVGVTDRIHTAFTVNVVLATLLAACGMLLAPAAAALFHLEAQVELFRLATLSLILVGLGNIHDSLLLRDMAFRRRIAPQIARSLVGGLVSIALALMGAGALALVIGFLAGAAVWTTVLWATSGFRPRLVFDAGTARQMASYGLGAASLEALSVIAARIDQLAIGQTLGSRALGLYAMALRLPELAIENVAWTVSSVTVPALSQKRARAPEELPRATLDLLRFQTLYALPMAAGIATLASPIVVVLFSSAWREAAGPVAAVAVMAGLAAISFPLGSALKAVGKQRVLVVLNVLELPLLVLAVVAAAPFGITFVAWARAGAELLHVILLGFAVSRIVAIGPGRVASATVPGFVAALGVGVPATAVHQLWPEEAVLPLLAAAGAGILGGLTALRAFTPAAFTAVLRQLRALRHDRHASAPR